MLSTVLLGSYLFFILLPVDSPYYLSQRLGPPLSGHFFFDLVHQMSARGGARGGAFPSAHVSGAVVVSLVAWRHQRRLAYLLVPITGGLMIATVYGRFHYVLDTLAGAGLAIAVVVVYSTSLRRRRPHHPAQPSEDLERLHLCSVRILARSSALQIFPKPTGCGGIKASLLALSYPGLKRSHRAIEGSSVAKDLLLRKAPHSAQNDLSYLKLSSRSLVVVKHIALAVCVLVMMSSPARAQSLVGQLGRLLTEQRGVTADFIPDVAAATATATTVAGLFSVELSYAALVVILGWVCLSPRSHLGCRLAHERCLWPVPHASAYCRTVADSRRLESAFNTRSSGHCRAPTCRPGRFRQTPPVTPGRPCLSAWIRSSWKSAPAV